MDRDGIQRQLGELKGLIKANHKDTNGRLDKLELKVDGLKGLHNRLKGAMAVISFLIAAVFQAIVESVRSNLGR